MIIITNHVSSHTDQFIGRVSFQPVLTVDTDLSGVWYSDLLNADTTSFLTWWSDCVQVQAMFHCVNQDCAILHTIQLTI